MSSVFSSEVLAIHQLLEEPDEETWGHRLSKQTGVPIGSIYGLLERFEEREWVSARLETDADRPSQREGSKRRKGTGARRTYYKLTELGRVEGAEFRQEERERQFDAVQEDIDRGLWPQPVNGAATSKSPNAELATLPVESPVETSSQVADADPFTPVEAAHDDSQVLEPSTR